MTLSVNDKQYLQSLTPKLNAYLQGKNNIIPPNGYSSHVWLEKVGKYSMQLQYCLSLLSYFLGDMSCFFKTLLVFHEKHKNISYEIYYSKKLAYISKTTTTCTCRHQQKVISTESGQSAIRKSYIVKWMDIKFDRTEMFSLLIIFLQLVTDIIGNNCERFNQDAGWTTCQIHLVWVILYVAVSVTIL